MMGRLAPMDHGTSNQLLPSLSSKKQPTALPQLLASE